MIYSNETGYCEWISYDKHQEEISEKNEQINELQMTIYDLEEEVQEHKEVINELKKVAEVKVIEEENKKSS